MVAHPHPVVRRQASVVRWWRLALAVAAIGAVGGTDTAWKAAAVAAGRHAIALDTPTTLWRPFMTLVIGLVALSGVMLLPRLCVPGALLAFGGVSSNIASLAIWHAVPNPLGVAVAGGILHFNEADLCIWGGGLLFLAATFWTVWRMPADQFA